MKVVYDSDAHALLKLAPRVYYDVVAREYTHEPEFVLDDAEGLFINQEDLEELDTLVSDTLANDFAWINRVIRYGGELYVYDKYMEKAVNVSSSCTLDACPEKSEPLFELRVGDVVFYNGDWREVERNDGTHRNVELDDDDMNITASEPGVIEQTCDALCSVIDATDSVSAVMTRAQFDRLPDAVEHPSHYNHGGRETIDDIKDHLNDSDWNAYQGGLLFNVYKYIDRAPYKGKRLEDLKKAAWYLNKLIEEVSDNDD
jgi:hypothetical protein